MSAAIQEGPERKHVVSVEACHRSWGLGFAELSYRSYGRFELERRKAA